MTAEEIAEAVAAGVRAAFAAAPAPLPRLLYTFKEAGEATGLPWTWFRDQSNAGHIPTVKVGRYRKISAAQLLAIVEAHEVEPTSGEKRKDLIRALAEIKAKAALAA
jgi:hypothetical protein